MWTVVFTARQYEDFRDFLFGNAPEENGCFLLAQSYRRNRSTNILIVTRIIKPSNDSWNDKAEYVLQPTSKFINQAVVSADNDNSSLIFVHTHPGSIGIPRFSRIDESSNEKIFQNLSQIIPDRPLASFVMNRKAISGVVYTGKRLEAIDTLRIIGKTLTDTQKDEESITARDGDQVQRAAFDRQIKIIGEKGQNALAQVTATVVGAGGTGSSVANQLARIGVGRIRILDFDVLEESNLSRVYGSKPNDVGKPKVQVLKRDIRTFSSSRVEAFQKDVTKNGSLEILLDSDVIFGCTDNLASRAVLNDVAIQYYIPLIDVGCRITVDKSNAPQHMVAKIQVVLPETACLWCSGTLDGVAILQESLPEEEKRKLVEEGYYRGIGQQPSIVSLTTLAGSLGVFRMLDLLGLVRKDYPSRTQLEMLEGLYVEDDPKILSSCICQSRRGKAGSRKISGA